MTPPLLIERALLARRMARAARMPQRADILLQEAAATIAERLAFIRRDFARAADLGTPGRNLADALAAAGNVGEVVRAVGSARLSDGWTGPALYCNEELLPFADASLELIASALSLHWVNDLPGCLAQISRALKPDGLFMAALMGAGTLQELRLALTQAEAELTGGAAARVMPFVDVRDMGALLQRAGLALPVCDVDSLTLSYEGIFALIDDLRAMGATSILSERSRKPPPRALFVRAGEIYQERFADERGRITATFNIIYAAGWAPHESQQKPLRPGSARARLADALGAREVSLREKPDADGEKGN